MYSGTPVPKSRWTSVGTVIERKNQSCDQDEPVQGRLHTHDVNRMAIVGIRR